MALPEITTDNRRHNVDKIAAGNFGELHSAPQHWNEFLDIGVMPARESYDQIKKLPTSEFLTHINDIAFRTVASPDYRDPETGYISRDAWKRLIDGGILASGFEDRDPSNRLEEMMQTAKILSYYDINLGLSAGITVALAILPIKRFGSVEQKEKYLNQIRDGKMIGLGITELYRSGSSALDMDSKYTINGKVQQVKSSDELQDGEVILLEEGKELVEVEGQTVDLKFSKHLQGLSGQDGLIIAAVHDGPSKKIGLFIVDQENIDTQLTQMVGLHGIPYGINTGDVTLSVKDHLMQELPRKRIVDEFADMFTKSRILFPSMVLGHLLRTEAEVESFASERMIGENLQKDMEVPRDQLDLIRSRRIVSEAIFDRLVNFRTEEGESLLTADTTKYMMEAGIVKVLTTEYAVASAADRAELMGAAAFYKGSGLQDYNNIWPFQIFEGSRKMLNTDIGRDFAKGIRFRDVRGDFFGQLSSGVNMEEGIFESVLEMRKRTGKSARHQQVLGQIAQRAFALECLDPEKISSEDFQRASKMLNLEIRHLTLDFDSLPFSNAHEKEQVL